MKKGLLYFQQGYTDIINQLPLINYYLTKYEYLTIIARKSAKPIYDFYLKNKRNVEIYYPDFELKSKSPSGFYDRFDKNEYDYLLHGKLDYNRYDKYKNIFMSTPFDDHWGKKYYTCYDIDYMNKVKYFEFERNVELEYKCYLKFVDQNTNNDYVLYHDNLLGDSTISFNKKENIKYINLNGMGMEMFHMIRILQNSKEIHLVDSMWASFCYMIDAKYQLLKNVPIFIYPFKERWGGLLKDISCKNQLEPILLDNWTIVK